MVSTDNKLIHYYDCYLQIFIYGINTLNCIITMKKVFQRFDNNAIFITPTKSFSTPLGQLSGFVLFLFMLVLLTFKLKAIIQRDIMYLNTYEYFSRFPVDMSDAGIRLVFA